MESPEEDSSGNSEEKKSGTSVLWASSKDEEAAQALQWNYCWTNAENHLVILSWSFSIYKVERSMRRLLYRREEQDSNSSIRTWSFLNVMQK